MTEELVTLETAKLLREKGFNEPCMIAINIEDGRQYGTSRTNSELPIKVCTYPTQSVAQKWLREIRGVYVYVEPVIGKDGSFLFVISMFQQKKTTGWRTK